MKILKKPVENIKPGDHVRITLTHFDTSKVARNLAAKPESIKAFNLAIAIVKIIPYQEQKIQSNKKYHISFGH